MRKITMANAVLGFLVAMSASAQAATIAVNTTADVVSPSDERCSLREAVTAANSDSQPSATPGECHTGEAGSDTIQLGTATYVLTRDTILSTTEHANVEDDLNVTTSMRIQGQGPAATTIEVQGDFRALGSSTMLPGPSLAIDGVTVKGGRATVADVWGGAILFEEGDLSLTNCVFEDNRSADGPSGGAFSQAGGDGSPAGALLFAGSGSLLIDGCVFRDNHAGGGGDAVDSAPGESNPGASAGAGGHGGAIYIHHTAKLTIKNSTFTGNSAGDGGDGGDAGGQPSSASQAAGGNGAVGGDGGAIYAQTNFQGSEIIDSTFEGNAAGDGGAGGAGASTGKNGNGGTGGDSGVIDLVGGTAFTRARLISNSAGDGGPSGNGAMAANPGNGGAGGSGGVYTNRFGVLTVADTTVSGNSAGDGGQGFGPNGGSGGPGGRGGAFTIGGSSVLFERTTLNGNGAGDGAHGTGSAGAGAGGAGGALYFASLAPDGATLLNSTFSGNSGGRGGNFAGNVPMPGGSGGAGGAIYLALGTKVTAGHTTIAGNASGQRGANTGPNPQPAADTSGGAIGSGSSGSVALSSSILAGNGGFACSGNVAAHDADTIAYDPVNPSCPGRDVDPLLGTLADNGGATQTMALGVGSPALDVAVAASCPAVDQRGVARPQGAGCDAGAFEREVVPPGPSPSPPPVPPTDNNGGNNDGGNNGGGDKVKPAVVLRLVRQRLASALARGYAANFSSNETGTARIDLFVGRTRVARGTKKLTRIGPQKVVAKFTSKARRRYRRARKLKLTVQVSVTDAAGNATVTKRTLTLRR
jgi:CSLREA domain-containing protein